MNQSDLFVWELQKPHCVTGKNAKAFCFSVQNPNLFIHAKKQICKEILSSFSNLPLKFVMRFSSKLSRRFLLSF